MSDSTTTGVSTRQRLPLGTDRLVKSAQQVPHAELTDSKSVDMPRPRRAPRGRMLWVWISLAWMGLLAVAIVLGPVLPLPDATRIDYTAIGVPPFQDPAHLLGTDAVGRDILARIIVGARVSMAVGLGAVAFATVFGSVIGVVAAYFRGWVDKGLGAGIEILLAFPPLIAVMALSVFLGPSLLTLILALGVTFTPQLARVARSSTLPFVKKEFVIAAHSMGASHLRILVREIAPNAIVPILSYAVVLIALAISAEGGLSFLGLGVPPPNSSWGTMMGEGRTVLNTDPHVVLVPATVMFLTLLSLNFLADYISRRFDIKEAAL